jgi:hypothetical protein
VLFLQTVFFFLYDCVCCSIVEATRTSRKDNSLPFPTGIKVLIIIIIIIISDYLIVLILHVI